MLRKTSSYWYKSAFYTILQRFSVAFFGVVSYLLLVRVLSVSQIGIWALFNIISATFEMSKYALLKNALITILNSTNNPEERAKIASSSLVINIIFTAIFILLVLFLGSTLGHYWKIPELHTMLKWYILSTLFLIPFAHFEYLQQANMEFKGIFGAYFFRQGGFFLTLIIAIFTFKGSITLNKLVVLQAVCILGGSILSFFYARKYLKGLFSPTRYWIKKLFHYGKYVLGSGICSSIFGSMDRYMTASFMSSVTVAFYDVGARINNMIDIPTTATTDIIFPKSAKASYEEGKEKVKYMYERMSGILAALVFPVSLFVFIFAEPIIKILAGERYLAATSIVRISMLYAVLRPIQIQAGNILNSINKPNTTFYLNVVILTVNLLLNYFLVKYLGFMGAAYGGLLSTVFSFGLTFYFLKNAIGTRLPNIFIHALQFYKNTFEALKQRKFQFYKNN